MPEAREKNNGNLLSQEKTSMLVMHNPDWVAKTFRKIGNKPTQIHKHTHARTGPINEKKMYETQNEKNPC